MAICYSVSFESVSSLDNFSHLVLKNLNLVSLKRMWF